MGDRRRVTIGGTLAAGGLGAASGMRSTAGVALVARELAHWQRPGAVGPEAWLQHPAASRVTGAMLLGELVADKLPIVGDRTEPRALAGRFVAGALSGAALMGRRGESTFWGAAVGGAAAVASVQVCYRIRRHLTRHESYPDAIVALAEDAFALGTAALSASRAWAPWSKKLLR